MDYIPCLICFKLSEATNDKAIAKICKDCEKNNIDNFIKNLDYKKVQEVLEKSKNKIKLTKDGELI